MNLKNASYAALVGLLVLATVAHAGPIAIDIANPGFDANGEGWTPTPTGWTTSGPENNAGAVNTSGKLSPLSSPDFGYINPLGGLGQLLKAGGSALQVKTGDQISISFFQGLRDDQSTSTQDLRVQLWSEAIGTGSLIQETSFGIVPVKTWVGRTVTYIASASDENRNLYLQLYCSSTESAQIAIDNVSGTYHAAPEPGTLVLLAAGLIGLLAYAWRKRR
jgi:hypothetical protein